QFEPGARFGYSNSGYVLLGLVVERVSGKSYYSYVARHVFRPAGMTATGCFWKSRRVPNRAVGYEPSGRPDTASLPPRGTSAGGCYSTAGDMLRFANALFGHRLLSPAMTRTVTTGKVAAPGGRYGYGFGIRGPRSSPTVWHNGGSPGAGAELDVNPKLGYTVVVLANVGYPLVAPALDLVLNALRVP